MKRRQGVAPLTRQFQPNNNIEKQQLGGAKNFPLDLCPQLAMVFADLDLTKFPNVSPNAPPDVLANYIIENQQLFRKKEIRKKKIIDEDTLEPTMVNLVNAPIRPIETTGSLLSAFVNHFHEFFEAQTNSSNQPNFDKDIVHQLLHQNFPSCRTPFVEHLVAEFNGRYSIAASICYFVESGLSHLIRKYFLHVEDSIWKNLISLLSLPRKRRKTWIEMPREGNIFESIRCYELFWDNSRKTFSQLFSGKAFSSNAESIIVEEKRFTCLICFDDFPQKEAIMCSFPEIIDLLPNDKIPSTSACTADQGPHSFCLECIRGQAVAATTEMPLADGGIGLKCMAPNCPNPILFSKCRSLIPYRVRKLLNERIIEEMLGMANLENLERCKRCNYAVQFEIPKDVVKVFSCFKCGYEFCRICERDWDDNHFGKRCEEIDEIDKASRDVHRMYVKCFSKYCPIELFMTKIQQYFRENKMSETLIRRCHKCNLPFVKWDGCNRVHCRCGATQCYVCRAHNIKYTHFCQHLRIPNIKGCQKCKKTCLLWDNTDSKINAEVEKIRKDAEKVGIIIR